jgi:hypothetical protein
MRGMWAGDKPRDQTVRLPAMDALCSCDPSLVCRAIQAATNDGCALTFSMTRDKGSLVVTLLNGNDRPKVYVKDAAELTQCLQDLLDSFEPTSPPVKAKR